MRFRLPAVLAAVAAPLVGLVGLGPAASAEPYPPGDYRIMTDHGGYCLNSPPRPDARATVGDCGTVWRFRLVSDGIHIIRAEPDACLGVSPRDRWPRHLAVRSCEKEPTLWYATRVGDGKYVISLAADGQLVTWHEGGQPAFLVPERKDHGHQLWTFVPAGKDRPAKGEDGRPGITGDQAQNDDDGLLSLFD